MDGTKHYFIVVVVLITKFINRINPIIHKPKVKTIKSKNNRNKNEVIEVID